MLMWWSSASSTRAPPGGAGAFAATPFGFAIAVPVAGSMCIAFMAVLLLPAPSVALNESSVKGESAFRVVGSIENNHSTIESKHSTEIGV